MNWSEVNISLIVAIAGILTAVGGFFIAIFNSDRLRINIINSLIRKVNGRKYITIGELAGHDIVMKLKQYIGIGQHVAESVITDEQRAKLYRVYVVTFCEVFLESVNSMLSKDLMSMTEVEFKTLVIDEVAWRHKEYNERFFKYLITLNSDKNAATTVLDKIEKWRILECELITSNVLNIISNGDHAIEYKIDIIFHQYSLGIDMLCKNGADSFERLNGELTNFLTN